MNMMLRSVEKTLTTAEIFELYKYIHDMDSITCSGSIDLRHYNISYTVAVSGVFSGGI